MGRMTKGVGGKRRPKADPTPTKLVTLEKVERARERTQQLAENHISFSFYYFKYHNEKYNMGNVTAARFIKLKEVLRDVSNYSMKEFIPAFNHSQRWRCHGLEEDIVAEFELEEAFLDQVREGCFQFSITQALGRVLGFNIHSVFFIVLLDFHHNAYPGSYGVQLYSGPVTLEDELQALNMSLQDEVEALKTQIKQLEDDYLQALLALDEKQRSG